MTDPTSPRYTPLRDRHEALGASFTDFGGWMMPVRYTSDLAEHRAVRDAAGLFDISHMAEFLVTGSHAGAFLDFALAGRLSTMKLGKAKYSLLLAEDGGIIDDVIVYRLGDDWFVIIANAGNHDAVAAALDDRVERFSSGVRVEDVSDASSLIAVQGPRAAEILAATDGLTLVEPPAQMDAAGTPWTIDELPYYAARGAAFDGTTVLVCRTGYTGEDGFELLIANEAAPALWDALLAAGEPMGLVPAGLAARDSLRLEAGMPLYGHELSRDILPAQAGLGRVVAHDKDDFIGKAALGAIVATDAPVLVGLVSEGRRAGRAGYPVTDADGEVVGEVTSGALSPTLGHPIALAYVRPAHAAEGTELAIDVRGTRIPATVTAPPFYRRKK